VAAGKLEREGGERKTLYVIIDGLRSKVGGAHCHKKGRERGEKERERERDRCMFDYQRLRR